jgi:hypothetical protein
MIVRWLIAIALIASAATAQVPLARSRPLIREFARITGYPHGRPGYVVDHRIPLCAGGADALHNLQWQERRASYVKDVFERALCRDMQRQNLIMVPREP